MQESEVWRAIDALAARHGLTASGLARAAGLDPTAFNKSKRSAPDGKPRWPSTESVARALAATGASWGDFAALIDGANGSGRAIPIVSMARADAGGSFDANGFPMGNDETVRFPGNVESGAYALEIAGDSMTPVFRAGDVVIVQPGADVRRGDRVVVRTRAGEVMAKLLGRRNDQSVELISFNPDHPPKLLKPSDIAWMARIVWASQ